MKLLLSILSILCSIQLLSAQWGGPADTFAFAQISLQHPDGSPYNGMIQLSGTKPWRKFEATVKNGRAKAKLPYDDIYTVTCEGVVNYKKVRLGDVPYLTHRMSSYTYPHIVYIVEYLNYEGQPLEGEEVIVDDHTTKKEYRKTTNKKGICKFYLPIENSYTSRVENMGPIRRIQVVQQNKARLRTASTIYWYGQEGYIQMQEEKVRMQAYLDSIQKVEEAAALKEKIRKDAELIAYIQDSLELKARSFKDPRDGRSYKTIILDGEEWMAENMAYKLAPKTYSYESEEDKAIRKKITAVAYEQEEKNVKQYGRLYNWEDALRVCPDGWHLATSQEWGKFLKKIGGMKKVGGILRSKEDWGKNWKGTDLIGFNIKPAGYGSFSKDKEEGDIIFNFQGAGKSSHWIKSSFWTDDRLHTMAHCSYVKMSVNLDGEHPSVRYRASQGVSLRSVRCVRDQED